MSSILSNFTLLFAKCLLQDCKIEDLMDQSHMKLPAHKQLELIVWTYMKRKLYLIN